MECHQERVALILGIRGRGVKLLNLTIEPLLKQRVSAETLWTIAVHKILIKNN